MDDSSDSTITSPLNSPSPTRSRNRDSARRTHRSSKDKTHANSSKELVRLLVHEEHETQELRSMVHILSERLSNETLRAETAETRAKEAVLRFKQVNDARVAALQEASRASEELGLYKLQLENAQREIRRAQELLDAVEAQRHEAEEAAARARSTARKLKEEKLSQIAREEGRLEGIKEGIARGRVLGYEEGRSEAYSRGRTAGGKDAGPKSFTPRRYDTEVRQDNFDTSGEPRSDSTESSPRNPTYAPQAEKIVVHPPPTSQTPPAPSRTPDGPIHPVLVHNFAPSPQHSLVDFPPDGWVPVVDEDNRIRLPPPHELAPAPYTPGHSPSTSPGPALPPETPDSTILMIPPPNRGDMEPDYVMDARRPRPYRRNSDDSQSTRFSEFELTGPPLASSARSNPGQRSNVLSAIVEERSPSMAPSPYAPHASPSLQRTPQMPLPVINEPTAAPQGYYRADVLRSPDSTLRPSPPRSPRSASRLTASPKGSILSNAGFNITVEPPSRPESGRSGYMGAGTEYGLLSAGDAEHPLPPTQPEPQPSGGPQPISLPDGQLPPGFMPIGAPSPVPNPKYSPDPQTNASNSAPTATGNASSYMLYTPRADGPDNPTHTTDPVVIPLTASTSGARRYSRTAVQKDSSSSEETNTEPISSGVSSSSMDSFTTPPQRKRTLATPSYATAPTPPNVTYPLPSAQSSGSRTGYTAGRVPLPPSTVGSPRTTVSAARVPLPASSVGSPRSAYTRTSKRGGGGSAIGANFERASEAASPSPIMLPPRGADS